MEEVRVDENLPRSPMLAGKEELEEIEVDDKEGTMAVPDSKARFPFPLPPPIPTIPPTEEEDESEADENEARIISAEDVGG